MEKKGGVRFPQSSYKKKSFDYFPKFFSFTIYTQVSTLTVNSKSYN